MKKLYLLIVILFLGFGVWGQSVGDYRTIGSGDWNDISIWETLNTGRPPTWKAATSYPNFEETFNVYISEFDTITIPAGLTITYPGYDLIGSTGSCLIIEGILDLKELTYTVSSEDIEDVDSKFPNFIISGTCKTEEHLNVDTLIVTSTGLLEIGGPSYENTNQGWWSNSASPSLVSLKGTIKYSSPSVVTSQYIPSFPDSTYNNFIINSESAVTYDGTLNELVIDGTLTIGSTAELTISDGTKATVNNLTLNTTIDPLTIKSTSTSTGSLIITGSVSGSGLSYVKMESFISNPYPFENSYHLISPPLDGMTLEHLYDDNSGMIPARGDSMAMLSYTAGVGWGSFLKYESTDPINLGEGYFIVPSQSASLIYTGSIQTSNLDHVTISSGGTAMNCLGNPFTSSIGIRSGAASSQNFLDVNLSLIDPSYLTIYVWDQDSVYSKKSKNHFTSLAGDYLQSGQGFFIKAASNGDISFTRAMQSHQNDAEFYKKSTSSLPSGFVLKVIDDNYYADTEFKFEENMSKGLDPGNDLGLFGGIEYFNLYTKLIEDNGVKFMVQALPNDDFSTMTIPIGFDYTGGEVSFSAECTNLPAECQVILEDRTAGVYTNLFPSGTKYTVNLASGNTETGRFFLHTFDPTTVNTNIDNFQNITTFAFDKTIHIQGNVPVGSKAGIYDVSGRFLKQVELNAGALNLIPAQELKNGIYIVKISGENLEKVTKLVLE